MDGNRKRPILERQPTEDSALTHFRVPDMTCEGCVRSVTQAVRARDPGSRVEADLPNHQVSIASSLDGRELASVLEDAGYTPAPIGQGE